MHLNKPPYRRKRFWFGVITNIAVLIILHSVIDAGYLPNTAVLAFLFVVAAAAISGFWAGLISAVFYAAFAWSILIIDPSRLIVNVLAAFVTGGLLGYYSDSHREAQPKVKFVDSLNGNLVMLHVIVKELDRLLVLIPAASRESLEDFAGDIRAQAANLTTNTQGWVAIARARGWIESQDGD